ncbi:MAG TPA: prepilin-type N-terminal cleavage/methylation domain-containing protein [Thermoanaerobaculia bacterium]|nr:prepilin-type N-terminal cleavage/methylation domain-containing protein [Thermoanaerobaculia bacterium]
MRPESQRGFTLIELLVVLVVIGQIFVLIVMLFDFSTKLSHVQTNVAEMQQSLRVAQYDTVRLIRMAGRGGLPVGIVPASPSVFQGVAVAVSDNVPNNTKITTTAGAPFVVPGTDILTIRGVLSNPVWQLDVSANSGSFQVDSATTGHLVVQNVHDGVVQDLSALKNAVQNGILEPLILVSATDPSVYAVVELDPNTSDVSDPTQFTIHFKISGQPRSVGYLALCPGGTFPATLNANGSQVVQVGILEEYRIYVRQDYSAPLTGNVVTDASNLGSKLARARVFPNSNDPYGPEGNAANVNNLSLDVADNITDLQVALGFDSANAGSIDAGTSTTITETADGSNDDWLFNGPSDLPVNPATWNNTSLYYVRLSTLARTDRPDVKYLAPPLLKIEDRSYSGSPFNQGNNLMFRRRLLQTVVNLRSLG